MRRAGITFEMLQEQAAAAERNSTGYAPYDVPLPPIDDAGLARVLARAPSDPHVDIVVMHRTKCGHCKPELNRVAAYVKNRSDKSGSADTSAYAVEIDKGQNIDALRALLLDDDWASPATGYFQGGQLRLSSPSRKRSVPDLVAETRGAPAPNGTSAPAPKPAASVLGSDRVQ